MQTVFTITIQCDPANADEVGNVAHRAVDYINESFVDADRTIAEVTVNSTEVPSSTPSPTVDEINEFLGELAAAGFVVSSEEETLTDNNTTADNTDSVKSLTYDGLRPATSDEAFDYFSGNRTFPGAVETEHGLLIPED